jgi:hypothetical protein
MKPKTPQRGADRYNAKLTDHDVRLIRELVAERSRLLAAARALSNRQLAEKFDVNYRTIEKVAEYRSWIHV